MVACAGAGLNMPPHVELDLLAAHASARRHHRVPHAIAAGTIHPRVTLIQVTATGVVISEPAGAPGIRGVPHPRLRTLLVAQSRLGSMECRGYILKEKTVRLYKTATHLFVQLYVRVTSDNWSCNIRIYCEFFKLFFFLYKYRTFLYLFSSPRGMNRLVEKGFFLLYIS